MNKNIIITGCSSGIGLACANVLKNRGWRVLTTARQAQDVERLKQDGFESYLMNMASSDSIQKAFTQICHDTNGTIDALFNNAGFGQPGAVEDLSRDVLRQQFETNVFGLLELTNLVIPLMRQQNHGRLVFNSSLLGIVAMPYRGAYNASKFALEGLVDTLRIELSDTALHVSLIEPGPIDSQFRANAFKLFEKNINISNSAHKTKYQAMINRLNKKESSTPFTLPNKAVAEKLIHALEHKKPKPHYPVTKPAYAAFFLRRFLPTRYLDKIAKLAGR